MGGLLAFLQPILLGLVGVKDFWEDVQLIKDLQFAFWPCLIFWENTCVIFISANNYVPPSHDFRVSKLLMALSRLFVHDGMLWSFHFGYLHTYTVYMYMYIYMYIGTHMEIYTSTFPHQAWRSRDCTFGTPDSRVGWWCLALKQPGSSVLMTIFVRGPGSLNYPFDGDQTMQLYDNFDGFQVNSAWSLAW